MVLPARRIRFTPEICKDYDLLSKQLNALENQLSRGNTMAADPGEGSTSVSFIVRKTTLPGYNRIVSSAPGHVPLRLIPHPAQTSPLFIASDMTIGKDGNISLPAGSAATPAVRRGSFGIYFDAGVAVSAEGVKVAEFLPSGMKLTGGATVDHIDPDPMLAADSDTRIPTQKAVKAYADAISSGIPGPAPVSSVFGRTGAVVAQTGDYSIGMITGAGTMASQDANNVNITGGNATGLGTVGSLYVTSFFGTEVTLSVQSQINLAYVKALSASGVSVYNANDDIVVNFGSFSNSSKFYGLVTSLVPSGNTACRLTRGAYLDFDIETNPMRIRSNTSASQTMDVMSGSDTIVQFIRSGSTSITRAYGALEKEAGGDMAIKATADVNALRVVDSSGRVGIGTSTPAVKFHTVGRTRITATESVAFEVQRTSAVFSNIFVANSTPGNAHVPVFQLARSRGSISTQTAPQAGDVIGLIGWATRAYASAMRVASQYVELLGTDGPGVMHFRMATTAGANSYTSGNYVLSLYPTLHHVRQPFQFDSSVRGPVRVVSSDTTIASSDFALVASTSGVDIVITFPTSSLTGRVVVIANNDLIGLVYPSIMSGVSVSGPSSIAPGQAATYMLVDTNRWMCIGKSA